MTPVAIEPELSGRSLHDLRVGDHWCELYHQDEEHLALLKQFFADGLAQHHKLLYIAEPALARAQFAELERAGLEIGDALRRGQLVTSSPREAYLVDGRFDREWMLAQWERECQAALAAGYSALRAAGEPTWALQDVPGSEELATYESQLNDFARTHPCIIFCQYDARRFPPKILLDVLSSHPVAVLDNAVLGNPYFVPPEEARSAQREAVQLTRWVRQLRAQDLEERRARGRRDSTAAPGMRRAFRTLAVIAGCSAAAIALVVLAGYALGLRALTTFGTPFTNARPLAAIAILLGAVALQLCLWPGGGKTARRWRAGCVAVMLAIGAAALLEWMTAIPLGSDRLLFPRELQAWGGGVYAERISLPTALGLVLLGTALLLLDWEPRRGVRPAQWLALAAAALSLIVLQGHTFGVASLSSFGLPIAMSLPVALGLALLALATLFARPDTGAMCVVSSAHAGGALLRWTLPLAIGGIWFLGWLSQWGVDRHLYPEGVDQLLFALPLMVLFTVALSNMAHMMNRAGERQQEQRRELEDFNRELEARVRERTAQLQSSMEAVNRASRYARSLLEASLDPLVTISREGKITDVNAATEKVTGKTRAALIGTDFCEYFTEPDAARRGYERVFAEESVYDYPLAIRGGDGKITEVLYNATVFRNEGGEVEGVFAAARDVTARKRAERELRRLNRAHKALSRCSDAVTRAGSEGTLLQEVCDLAVQVGGYRLVWVGYAQDDADKSVLPMAYAGDGADYVCNAGITWADTERGHGPTGISLRTGEPCFVADVGTEPSLAPWREAALAHGYHSVMTAPLKDGDHAFGTLNFYAADSDAFDAEERGLVVELAATLSHAVLALRARADRDLAAAEVRALNETLERRVAERTAALAATNQELEAFTYSVAHDLRTPLRHIHGFVTLLAEDYAPQLDDTARDYVDHILRGSQQMGQLIDDLLNLSRVGRQQLVPQVVGLNRLVDGLCAELAPEAAGRRVTWSVGELPFVECDAALVRQVFHNLLSNALKFTRPRAEAIIEIGRLDRGGEAVLFVRDNGVGFNMKYADKLFGVFQRLHRQEDFEGTGVGLVTVQRIIHKHGGRIWAEAELDRGATFYFTLGAPLPPSVPQPTGESHATASR